MSSSAPPLSNAFSALHGAARLTDWGLIQAEGADAASFLHGQLTQDVTSLREGQARLAGFCSAKGRLLASFVVWRTGPQAYLLACSANLLAPTLKRLQMFVLRARCKLTDVSAQWPLWGLVGAEAAVLAPGLPAWGVQVVEALANQVPVQGTAIRLPDAAGLPRLLWVQSAEAPAPPLPALALADWQWLEVKSGIVRVTAATTEQFVPQMVNLELVGGVNFQKGCYPGQEVVARSQYRGTLKRRAQLFDAESLLHAGLEVFHDADPGQPAGLVALAAPRPGGGSSALVEVKLAALEAGSLHAGAADGPLLTRGSLPYALPSDAALAFRSAMDQRLYVYYRVPEPQLPDTLLAVQAMQQGLVARHPQVQAEVLRRPELKDGEVTLMEAYAEREPGALSEAFVQALAAAAQTLPQPRHIERFTQLA